MHPSVLSAYRAFTTRFEGALPFMYLDVKGLVTTGIGNLIDPVDQALGLRWKHSNGTLASRDEIRAAWQKVKARTDLKMKGGGAFKGVSDLVLDEHEIDQMVARKLQENEAVLRPRFPAFDRWPADAQLGLLSMAWAMGPHFKFARFDEAVNRPVPDFKAAAIEGHMNADGNPGLHPRNAANAQLFTNAAHAQTRGLPVDQLHWPESLLEMVEERVSRASHGLGLVVALGAALGGVVLLFALHARPSRLPQPQARVTT